MSVPATGNRMARRYLPGFSGEMNRLFGDLLTFPVEWEAIAPPANFVETEEAYGVEVEVPGYGRDEIEVTMEQGILSIRGEHSEEKEEAEGTYHLRERSMGSFARRFKMPRAVDAEKLTATLENGVLRVDLPKAAEAKARTIDVTVR